MTDVVIDGRRFVPEDDFKRAHQRALAAEAKLEQVRSVIGISAPAAPRDGTAEKGRRRLPRLLPYLWPFVIGAIIGGTVIPRHHDAPSLPKVTTATLPKPAHSAKLPIPPAGGMRTFSWARGTDVAWEVRFYPKDGGPPIVRSTVEPNLRLKLPAGKYTWYVFPVIEGVRSDVAVVATDYSTGD